MARESCSCGAAIQTLRLSQIVKWRLEHRHEIEYQSPFVSQPLDFYIDDDEEEDG
jgi:hypothetical protein